MRRFLVAALLALLAGPAAAFPTDIEINAGALDVTAAVHADGRLAIVEVINRERFAVRCKAVFRNGPEVGRARRVIVGAEDTGTLTWAPRREVVRLRVELRCERQD